MSTQQGEIKNVVDALRRALQGPVSALAAGNIAGGGGTFTISLSPNSFQAPGGVAQAFQSTADLTSQQGFNGSITLTSVDTLNTMGGSVGIPTPTVSVAPGTDGITVINVNVGASTPRGTYTVTVTGTYTPLTGAAVATQAIITVTVGSGAAKCANNGDCGTGEVCSGGNCVSVSPINPIQHKGPCVARDAAICRAEPGKSGAVTGLDGNCYCSNSDCSSCTGSAADALCQSRGCNNGPCGKCSSGICDTKNGNLCECTSCSNQATPITVSCPANVTACIDATTPTSQTAIQQFTVTNNNASTAYNIDISIASVGSACLCCGAGPSVTSGYSIGPGGSQVTTITTPLTCTSGNCYNYQLKVNVSLASSGKTIQTISCPFQICTTTSACFQLQAENTGFCGGSTAWVTDAITGTACSVLPTCGACPASCSQCNGVNYFNFRAVSVNNFAGTITLTCTASACGGNNPCSAIPASVTLTAGQTTIFATNVSAFLTVTGNINGTNTQVQSGGKITITGTSGTLSGRCSGTGQLTVQVC